MRRELIARFAKYCVRKVEVGLVRRSWGRQDQRAHPAGGAADFFSAIPIQLEQIVGPPLQLAVSPALLQAGPGWQRWELARESTCQLPTVSYPENYYLRIADILSSSSTNALPAAGAAVPPRTICEASIAFP